MSNQSNSTTRPYQVSSESFYVKIGDTYRKIKLNEVPYFYKHEKLTYIQFEQRAYPVYTTLKELEEQLYHQGFARVHRTYLVNLHLVNSVSLSNNHIIVKGLQIPIGQTYRTHALSRLNILR